MAGLDDNTNEGDPVQHDRILEILRSYIASEVLDGKDIGLEPSTPLLEWGVINSLEIARLVAFISQQFGVSVPAEKVVATYFKDLQALTALVIELDGRQAS